jgi:hypothetical protein
LAKGDPGGLTTIKQKLGDLKVALGDAGDSASMMGADMVKAL